MESRRDFAKLVTLATLGGATGVSPVDAQTPLDTRGSSLVDALVEVVRAQSGRHLTADELKRVRSDFEEYGQYLQAFRAFPLSNADEPDLTFQALAKRWP